MIALDDVVAMVLGLIVVSLVLVLAFVRPAHAQDFRLHFPPAQPAPVTDFATVRPLGNGSFVVNHTNGQPSQYLNPVGRTGTYAVAPTDPDRLYPPQYIHIDPPRDSGDDD